MRNLKNTSLEQTALPEDSHVSAITWDATDDSLIYTVGPTLSSPTIGLKRKRYRANLSSSSLEPIASWHVPCPQPDLLCDEIICLQHFADSQTTCVVLAGGDFFVIREEPQDGEEKIELVGSVDAGIAAAAWAPDEEVLAIVTRADTLILMTRYFEPVTELTLTAEDLKASKHVSVGWGKKETQFQGKRAKALRDPTMPEAVDEGKFSPLDNNKTAISWRGDGALLAVNRVVPNNRRVIRVLTREGSLESATEPVDGLESALAWRPAGNFVAGIQRLEHRLDVVFFERNGLRHGEFTLRLSKDEMETWASDVSLSWNVDSSVLAVSFRDRVQLWTMGNYHYYLKREILFPHEEPLSLPAVVWHPERPLRLALAARDRMIDTEYVFSVDKGSTVRPHDNGIVAVVDGRLLKLTPLKYAMVPPPMSFTDISVDQNIVDCSISLSGKRIALLTSAGIEVYGWDYRSKPAATPTKVASLLFLEATFGSNLLPREILLHTENHIHLLWAMAHGETKLSSYIVEDSNGTLVETEPGIHKGTEAAAAKNIFTDTSHEYVWLQTEKTLMCLNQPDIDFPSRSYMSCEIVVVPAHGERVHDVYTDATNACHQPEKLAHIFSLSRRGELFADRTPLAKGCTSFATTDMHLIFTTSQHLLKFVHIDVSKDYEVPGDLPEVDERCRSIERGAKIITVVPSTYAVILQMPRGNLETVYPRALVLAGIRQHLDDKDFKSAFLACQNHQVDMNILYDYHPSVLMDNIHLFIEQVKKVTRIDLFLSKLSEEDVSKTLYKDTLARLGRPESSQDKSTSQQNGTRNGIGTVITDSGKVNRICDAFLSLLKPQIPKHLQNVVTAYVCKRPPDLVSALELVASLKTTDANKAEEAISHLCFLTDVNRLYDTALALYNLPLTLLVAQQAQRDPREYVPFLQSLNQLSELRRRFRIDDYLCNYAKALTSLHSLAAHEEVEVYTIKHALYAQALKFYRYDTPHFTTITRLHATYLTSKSNHLASAISSEFLSDYALASTSYAKCSPPRWRESLHCATMIEPPLPPQRLASRALQLATTLAEEQRDYRSAAQIHTDYLHDIPTSARLLCRGSYFSEALRLLSLHHLAITHVADIIDVALAEKSGEITELMADCRAQLNAQVPRIQELRLKKVEDPLAFFGGDNVDGGEDDIPDNISLAPTNASTLGGQSLFTRYGNASDKTTAFDGTITSRMSRQTSKTRRREERKRARGKKGSVYEEEYLVGSVRRLVERVNGVQGEVGRLVEGLRRRGMVERVEVVEEGIMGVVGGCERAVGEVWGVSLEGGDGNGNGERGKEDAGDEGDGAMLGIRPKGGDGVFWESRLETTQLARRDAPEVKAWKSPVRFEE